MKSLKAKEERGSITLFVLIAMLFFLGVAIALFTNTMNSSTSQKKDIKKIQREYDDLDEVALENAYNDMYAKNNGYSVQFCDGLPPEYQEVDYIKSTSTQYIDTLVHPANTVDFEMDLKTDVNAMTRASSEMPNNKTESFFGTHNTTINRTFSLNFAAQLQSVAFTWKNNTYSNGATPISFSTITYNPVNKIKISCINDAWKVNNNLIGTSESVGTWKDETQNLIVFGIASTGVIKTFYENMYVYNLKIWDNNELIRDYIPCFQKETGKRGLFDIVNQKFYSNNGTGEFENGVITSKYAVNRMKTQTFTIGETKALSKNINTREGYTFTGWNTKPDGTGISYTDEQQVSNLSTQNGDLVYLYAQWQLNS